MPSTVTDQAESPRKPQSIDSVVKRIDEISTLPQVAMKLIEVANCPDAGAADLKYVVEGDPALSARVLRCVNSAAYALSSKITSLHQAITYLGFNQVRNLALTASVSTLFKNDEAIGTYRRTELWKHMVSVGICARLIATRTKMPNFDDAFMGGLLHDIGIVLEDQHVHPNFRQVAQALDETKSLIKVEREYLGFDHTILGARIAEQWKFPQSVQDIIRYHHMSANYRGPEKKLVCCVEIANVLCTLKGITSMGLRIVRTPVETFQVLGLQKEDIVVLAEDLDKEIALNESLFEA